MSTSPVSTPAVAAITSRKTASGIAKRLRAALRDRHKLAVTSTQSTELVAASLGYSSANHMAAALNDLQAVATSVADADPEGYRPFTVIVIDNYRDKMSIEHVEARSVDEAISLATAQYQVRIAEENGVPTPEEEEFSFLSGVGYAAVFSGHLACLLRAEDEAHAHPADAQAVLKSHILIVLHDIGATLMASSEPANRAQAARGKAILRSRITTLSDDAAIDWIALMVDLLELKRIVRALEREFDGHGDDLADHAYGLLDLLMNRVAAASGSIALRRGPVYGADPDLKLFQMTGAYGEDGGHWGAHVPARNDEEAVLITRQIMSENTGEYENGEIGDFEIVDQFDVDPRQVATKDLVGDPEFNSWSPALRAARVELRAREYLQGAGM